MSPLNVYLNDMLGKQASYPILFALVRKCVVPKILYILFFSLFSFSRLSKNLASPQTHFYTPDIPHYLAVVLMTAIQDEKLYLSYLLK